VDLSKAYELSKKYRDRIRIYPGSMEQRNSEIYALKSRTVAVVGIGANIEDARQISLEGIEAIKGGALWNRTDIASEQHIEASEKHMETLRRKQ
jgi:phosphoribosylamine-glycine ligase